MLNLCQIFSHFKLIQNSTSSSPTLVTSTTKTMAAVPNHTPMSERQQLALIKKLEKEAAEEAAAAASPAPSHNSTISLNPKMSSGILRHCQYSSIAFGDNYLARYFNLYASTVST